MNPFEEALSVFFDNPRHFLAQISESGSLDKFTDLLQNYFLALIKEAPRERALESILSIVAETQFFPAVQASCEQAMLWLAGGKYDPIITPAVLDISTRSTFAFGDHLKSMLPCERAPFFLSAFMPKSGGTFLTSALKRNCGYNTEIAYFVGSSGETRYNYLLKAKLPVFSLLGGVVNHAHLDPNLWNKCAIVESGLPFWLHLRDPRDCLLSAIHMVDLEYLRADSVSDQFYKDLSQRGQELVPDAPLTERALMYLETFEDYCAWASEWLAFRYDRKFVTFHHQLQSDPQGLAELINKQLGLDLGPEAFRIAPKEDYKSSRFNVGTNGRWAREFEPGFCDTLFDIMKRHGLADVFPVFTFPADIPALTAVAEVDAPVDATPVVPTGQQA